MKYCVHTIVFDDGRIEATLTRAGKYRPVSDDKGTYEFFETYEEALAAMPSGKADTD